MATFLGPHLDSQQHDSTDPQPASITKQGPSAADWDRVRPIIKGLYIDEARTLKVVMRIMADQHGHKATVKMYKLWFTKWEFDTHNREADMRFVVRKKLARDAHGKMSTFFVRSKQVSAHEIDRYAQRKQAADPTFEAAPADMATPIHILCFTPPGSPYSGQVQNFAMLLAPQNDLRADETISSTRLGKRRRSRSPSPMSPNALVTQQEYRRIRAWARSPSVPCVSTPPDTLRRCEMLFADLPAYVKGSIANGTWYVDNKGRLTTLERYTIDPGDFSNFCTEAIVSLRQSSTFLRGRRLLSKAFSTLSTLLLDAHPSLLQNLVAFLLTMAEEGFVGVAAMFQNHIAELVRTILPRQHIWRRICMSLSLSDPDHTEILERSWRCLGGATADVSGRTSWSSVAGEVALIFHLYRSTDSRRAEKLLLELLTYYKQMSQELNHTSMYIMDRIAHCLLDQGKHAEMEMVTGGALLLACEAGSFPLIRVASILEHLAWAQRGLLKDDLAEKTIRSAITMSADAVGKDDPLVVSRCCVPEGWLRKWGRDAEADQLLVEIDEMIGSDDIDFEPTVLSPT